MVDLLSTWTTTPHVLPRLPTPTRPLLLSLLPHSPFHPPSPSSLVYGRHTPNNILPVPPPVHQRSVRPNHVCATTVHPERTTLINRNPYTPLDRLVPRSMTSKPALSILAHQSVKFPVYRVMALLCMAFTNPHLSAPRLTPSASFRMSARLLTAPSLNRSEQPRSHYFRCGPCGPGPCKTEAVTCCLFPGSSLEKDKRSELTTEQTHQLHPRAGAKFPAGRLVQGRCILQALEGRLRTRLGGVGGGGGGIVIPEGRRYSAHETRRE